MHVHHFTNAMHSETLYLIILTFFVIKSAPCWSQIIGSELLLFISVQNVWLITIIYNGIMSIILMEKFFLLKLIDFHRNLDYYQCNNVMINYRRKKACTLYYMFFNECPKNPCSRSNRVCAAVVGICAVMSFVCVCMCGLLYHHTKSEPQFDVHLLEWMKPRW